MAVKKDEPAIPTSVDELRENLANLDLAEQLIEKGTQAGFDLSAQKAKTKELRDQLHKIGQSFFPGKNLR